jgi:hypothetical protein
MTPAARARKKLKREARALRKKERIARRKAKREARMAPKHAMQAWADAVRARDVAKCAVCGDISRVKLVDGVPKMTKDRTVVNEDGSSRIVKGHQVVLGLNAHHLLPREVYPQFKLEVENGITLCAKHHKCDRFSFHRNPIWAAAWLETNRPEQYAWCLARVSGEAPPLVTKE